MLVIVPNLNELIADLHGRLLPFGWLRLLARFWRQPIRSARVALMECVRSSSINCRP